ncbi:MULTISPECIES: HIT family protein [unclassified Pseudactinotalea]|uniref:HIT family protein n=1 Tax=unclassified Pseudactinotalea TaxID=2649176 RepID=UPI00128D3A74|nr:MULTISPECIES: HIT family protein [unclassified Pseudactinotalea]MPV49397.1 HIT domain-containing protein [Pseudactinotalea sp. HY160]QGH69311.1 HIT domain-containing protein [Pseudactinotalea sp. HY158]
MTSVFTRIIGGEIPGRFLWSDPSCVAFLTIAPIVPGHTLVVPRAEIDHWLDVPAELGAHLFAVAATIGRAQRQVYSPARIGLLIQGLEVPHTHLHVWPAENLADFDLARADHDPDPGDLDRAGRALRTELERAGHGEHVPASMARAD